MTWKCLTVLKSGPLQSADGSQIYSIHAQDAVADSEKQPSGDGQPKTEHGAGRLADCEAPAKSETNRS
jgi:hypothetical protein